MLKSLTPQPKPKLVCLCQARDWDAVRKRVSNFPQEATPSHTAIRGTSSTVLSIALRLGAPKHVLQDLQQANPHNVGVTHKSRGSLLHDALRYRTSEEVLDLVFRWTIEYQQSVLGSFGSNRNRYGHGPSYLVMFQQVHIQENRIVDDDLLGARDDLGRTVLHCLVECIQNSLLEPQRRKLMHIFDLLLQVHPDLVGVSDSDGNSPLVLALASPKPTIPELASQLEMLIHRMTMTMIELSPTMAFHVKSLGRPKSTPLSLGERGTMRSPLYHAILHGRHERTVETLIQGYHQLGINGCSTIVTPHYEVCLHVAVTMRAQHSVLRLIAKDYPKATTAGDVFGLNPIDWLWITHVKGWHGQSSRSSRRRYLGREYIDWHGMVSKIPNRPSQYDILDSNTVNELQQDMISRIESVVPYAAQSLLSTNHKNETQCAAMGDSNGKAPNLLHLICLVPSCCLGMVKLVLQFHSNAHSYIRQRDTILGRLPLHYAVSRIMGYKARLPIGAAARDIHFVQEPSPAFEVLNSHPGACQVMDDRMQLPLHVAIDSAKEARCQRREDDQTLAEAEDTLLVALLREDPLSLGKRDGLTRLFPWQQAAVGDGASLTTIYKLIRREPTYLA